MAIDGKAVAELDFSALSTARKLKPVHPGEVLLKDIIEPMGPTRYKVAKGTRVPRSR